MWMVKNPEWFDVAVVANMFGDIITDLGAMVQGGMGAAASGNIHPGQVSMFEPIHGSAPKYAGKNVSSPVATIAAVQMMLDHVGEDARRRSASKRRSASCCAPEDPVAHDRRASRPTRPATSCARRSRRRPFPPSDQSSNCLVARGSRPWRRSQASSIQRNPRSTTIAMPVSAMLVRRSPTPTAIPIPATSQTVAAVVSPRTVPSLDCRIAPAPESRCR
jgi:hypothetical protein